MAEEQSEPEEPKEDSGSSKKSLVDRLKDKGDIELTFEEKGEGIRQYFLVASYEGGKELYPLATEIPGIEVEVFAGDDESRIDKEIFQKYKSIAEQLLPKVAVESIVPGVLETFLSNLNIALTELAEAGIKVGKVGNYETPDKFMKAYQD